MMRGSQGAALLLAFLAIGYLAWFQIADPDVPFHLAAGREVLALHHVPQTNTLGYMLPDAAWGSHQWLGSVIIYLAYRMGGDLGLAIMKLIVVLAMFAFLVAFLRRERWPGGHHWGDRPIDLVAGIPLLVLGAWTARPRLVERPLLFSAFLEAFLLWFLAGYASRSRRRLFLLVPIFVVWWNLHAGFIYGLLILGTYIIGDALEPERRSAARSLFVAALAATAAGALVTALLNPAGLKAILFPFQMFRSSLFSAVIDEFRRPSLRDDPDFAALLVLAPLTLLVAWLRGWRPRLAHALLVIVFGALALSRIRMILDMAIVTSPLAAGYLTVSLAPRAGRVPRWAPIATAACAAVIVYGQASRSVEHRHGHGFDARTNPAEAYDFLANEHLPGEVLVADIWSGSFLWHFYPERKAFIHNQLEVYGEPFWRDVYLPLLAAAPGWRETLDRNHMNTLILRYSGERYRQRIADAVFSDPGWVLVYWDDLAMIFVRNTEAAAGVIHEHAFRVLNPEHPELARIVAMGGGALAEQELDRELAEHPKCRRAWSFLGEMRLEMGKIPEGEEAYHQLASVADHPGETAAALAGLARARWMSGQPAAAESLYTTALALRRDDPYLLARRARMRLQTGDMTGARDDARRTERSHATPADLVYLGEAFADSGRGEEADRLFARAAEAAPAASDRARILQRAALAWERLKDPRRAEAAYRGAMAADPKWVDPPNNLAWLLMDAGRTEDGVSLARAAVALAPGDGYPWGTLGRGLLETGRADSAVVAYEKAIGLMETGDHTARAVTMMGLARAYAAAGRRDAAVHELEQAESLGLSGALAAQAESIRTSIGAGR